MNMKNDNNLIIFDYDGTIVDSEKTIVSQTDDIGTGFRG